MYTVCEIRIYKNKKKIISEGGYLSRIRGFRDLTVWNKVEGLWRLILNHQGVEEEASRAEDPKRADLAHYHHLQTAVRLLYEAVETI